MITHSKSVVNNKCQIVFDFTPDDVTYSRNNYTARHKGGGTTSRQGIWEGIECIKAEVKVGNEGWKTYSLPGNKKVTITVSSNNVEVQARGLYRLKTMGYYFKDTTGKFPFFWYGNVDGKATKYQQGYYTDSLSSKPPSNFNTIHACVPADWKYIKAEWSDWAYKYAQSNSKYEWAFSKGKYSQRNANTQSATYGSAWISDSGHKQIYRKSSLFWFEKTYTSSKVVTSGIAVNPSAPTVNVYSSKGDTGKVEFIYNANNSGNGRMQIEAKCKDKTITLMTYDNSAEFKDKAVKTLNPDFNSLFGESYRANDVYYRAKAKNVHNYESSWTDWKGVHRYNGRPTIPQNVQYEGKDGLIYERVILSWNASSDPDGDNLYYQLYITAKDKNGSIVKNGFIHERLYETKYEYDISSFPDGTNFEFWVKASDGQITSDWSEVINFQKGSKPTSIVALIAPIKANTNIYSDMPRFGFEGYEEDCDAHVVFNDIEYNSKDNPEMFDYKLDKFIFKPTEKLEDGKVFIKAYIKNPYGESNHTQIYEFEKKSINKRFEAGDIITTNHIQSIKTVVNDIGNAYLIYMPDFDLKVDVIILASVYNRMLAVIKDVNGYINSLVKESKFAVKILNDGVEIREIITDKNWIDLINDIKSI